MTQTTPPGTLDLGKMLEQLDVILAGEPYCYVRMADGNQVPPADSCFALIREAEGQCAILPIERAEDLGLEPIFKSALLSLTVHSSLEAVGLTAWFSARLGEAGISCNVIAGLHHDHILVPWDRRFQAVEVLKAQKNLKRPQDVG